MENASKALLMAGGILIALLVIGALLLMVNQIGVYQQSKNSSEKNTQLAKFNMDFERYLDDKGISGSDIVTLANKIIDYNSKAGTTNEASNSVDYNIKMTLTVKMTGFKNKYGYNNGGVFSDGNYIVNNNNGNLKTIIDTYNSMFSGNNKKLITQLTDVYDRNANRQDNINNVKKVLVENKGSAYESWNGTTNPTIEQIKNYKEYTEFRTSTYIIEKDPEYENGQIKNLYFKWKN